MLMGATRLAFSAFAALLLLAACSGGASVKFAPDGDFGEQEREVESPLDGDPQDADSRDGEPDLLADGDESEPDFAADGDESEAESELDLSADGDEVEAEPEAEAESEAETETETETETESESETESEAEFDDPSPLVAKVATGGAHSCALLDTGAVYCWGSNVYGQLGMMAGDDCVLSNGSNPCSKRPLLISSLAGTDAVSELALGDSHSCALFFSGKVKCWGRNNSGQLGDGTKTDRQSPAEVKGLPGACKAITARGNLTCALTESGAAYCWGDNRYGQLGESSADTCQGYGDNTYSCSTTPVAVRDLSGGVLAISAGVNHVCAQPADKTLRCWGYNGYGNLGNGTTTDSTTPLAVLGLPDTTDPVAAFSVAGNHSGALTESGKLYLWGIVQPGMDCAGYADCCGIDECHMKPDLFWLYFVERTGPPISLAFGMRHSCTLLANGEVVCWGDHFDGSPYSAESLSFVKNIGGALAIATGGEHSCAINKDHKLRCWGPNGYGQLGVRMTDCLGGGCYSETPIPVEWNL